MPPPLNNFPAVQHKNLAGIADGTQAMGDHKARAMSQEAVQRFLVESVDLLGGSKINAFVPVLAHRFARERLKALAQADGLVAKERPEVLFVCVQNAGRSQLAAGIPGDHLLAAWGGDPLMQKAAARWLAR